MPRRQGREALRPIIAAAAGGVLAAGGGGGGGVAFQSVSRPADLTLTKPLNIAGDSVPFGVGVPLSGTKSFQNRLDALTTGTINKLAVSGSAWNTPAWTGSPGNPDPIPDKILAGANYATNRHFASGSVNGYNNQVVQGGAAESQNFAAFIKTGVDTVLGPLSQEWIYFLGPYAEAQGPGMTRHASWRHLLNQLRASYGGRAFDLMRALQFRGSQDQTTLDWKNVDKWNGLPLSFRGMPIDGGDFVAFSNATPPTAWLTVNTATNTSAGIAAATEIASGQVANPANYPEGTLLQNISTSASIPTDNVWRVGMVSGAKKWVKIDPLHMSEYGADAWALIGYDILAAWEGTGAPLGSPAELFCAQDAASGAACGVIGYSGAAAPDTAALFDMNGVAITTLTLSIGAPTNGFGTITVTRSGSGTLAEGEQRLILQTTGAGHVQHSPVDFRIGQPSTQTTPRLLRIPGTTDSTGDCSIQGRSAHGLLDGDKFGFALWAAPEGFAADQQYVIYFAAANGNTTTFHVRISTGGNLNIIANNAAGNLILNSSIAGVFTSGQPTWVAVDIDVGLAAPTVRGYFNKNNAATDTAISAGAGSGTTAGPTTLALSKIEPRFLSVLDASYNNETYTTSLATRDQFRGRIGNIIVWNGHIGIDGAPSVARLLWQLGGSPGQPAARAPYSAINGITPVYDIQGGPGDALRGGFNQNEPAYWTYRSAKALAA